MADEHEEGNSPRSTSEATPPYVVDSPELFSPLSPDEITSTTDYLPSEIADSAVEQSISSTSEQEWSDGAESSSGEPTAVRLLLETSEAGSVAERNSHSRRSVPGLQLENRTHSDEQLNPETRQLLDQPRQLTAGEDAIPTGLASAPVEENQASPEVAQTKEAEGGEVGSPQEIVKDSIKRNDDEEKSDDSNQQFDVEDLSPASKSSENVDLGSQSSPTESGISVEEQIGSGSDATGDAGAKSYSYPKLGVVIKEEGSSEIGATENVSLEGELSSSKLDASIPGSGIGATGNVGLKIEFPKTSTAMLGSGAGAMEGVGLKGESSPSKTDTAGVEGSSSASSTPVKVRDKVSPKRKSPVKVEHLLSKRSAPFTSPDRLRVQGDSNMSTLLEELGIEETKDKPGTSGLEQRSTEMDESEECKMEEMEQESNMEVQETDSQNEEGEITEKLSEKDDSEMEDAD